MQGKTFKNYLPILLWFGSSSLLITNTKAFAPTFTSSISRNSLCKDGMDLNMVKKVFIDGEAGTTGLQVRDRLSKREDLEIISPPSDLRKDAETRKKFINEADAVILCTYLISYSF